MSNTRRQRSLSLIIVLLLLASATALGARLFWREEPDLSPRRFRGEAATVEVTLIGQRRQCLVRSPRDELVWELDIPPAGVLELAAGIVPEHAGKVLGGLTVQVLVAPPGLPEKAAEVAVGDLVPHPRHPRRSPWLTSQIDLAAHAGRKTLVIRALPRASTPLPDEPLLALVPPLVYSNHPQQQPNVLLISVDTLRADRLGAYGYERPTSPEIDRLAAHGVLIERAFTTQGATWPALTSLMTSLYPSQHGVTFNGYRPTRPLTYLAELFYAKGYATAGFLANMGPAAHPGMELVVAGGDRQVLSWAQHQLRNDRHKPFFIWAHFLAPHAAYAPPPEHARRFIRGEDGPMEVSINELRKLMDADSPPAPALLERIHDLYDAEVAGVDEMVGQLLATLDELGLSERTLVVFTADHGEDLYQHHEYFFHASSAYDSSLHVPLIMRYPGVLPAPERVDVLASILDVAPTVLEVLGLPALSSFEGMSLVPVIAGAAGRSVVISEMRAKIFTARTADFRYIHNPEGHQPAKTNRSVCHYRKQELYVHPGDPGEQLDLLVEPPAHTHDQAAAALRAELEHWQSGLEQAATEQEVDEELRRELEALGYVN